MKRLLVVGLLICGMAAPAMAAEPETPTVQQCSEILAGLLTLSDGYYGTDKDGKVITGQDGKAVKIPYKLGKLRLPIATNITLLRGVLKDAEDARQALVRELIPDLPDIGADPLNPVKEYRDYMKTEKYKKFMDAYTANMTAPPPGAKITLARIKSEDLKVGDAPADNPIPPITLSQLGPILE